MLGYTLIAAGIARIGEVLLVLPNLAFPLNTGFAVEDPARSLPETVNEPKTSAGRSRFGQAFLHLPPFVSHCSRRCGRNLTCLLSYLPVRGKLHFSNVNACSRSLPSRL